MSPDVAFDPAAWPLSALCLPDVLRRQAQAWGDKVFLTEIASGRRWSYREIDAWTSRVANALAARGVSRGLHVGVYMGNSAEHLAVFFALGKLGAVSVPINTAARGELLRYYLTQSDAKCVVADAELLERLREVLPLTAVECVIAVGARGEPCEGAAGAAGHAAVDFAGIVRAASDAPPAVEVKFSDLLMLSYTSGTTGPSKGVMVSHAAALTYGTSAAGVHGYRSSDVFYVCLPLFHVNALLAATGAALICGASVALSPRFSLSRFLGEIRESGATITNLLGAMSNFLWSQPPGPHDTDHRLRLVSAAPTPKYAREFEQRFKVKTMNNYGLSDFAMATAYTAHDPAEKLGSIGRPRPGITIRIVDDDDVEVPIGETGEIVMRTAEPWRAATGYYRMPEATLAANRNQWFHTGDRAYQDADGYLWFVDRKKDCIRRRGENVSAYEVEAIIATHPAVANAAVFPVAVQGGDEEVAAAVVLREGASLTERELIEHCARNMAYFMVPRFVQLRDALPTTVNQKVEKFRLKQQFEGTLAQLWDREAAGMKLTR